ncbi:Patatin-like phospholipase [compost metagenome]
MISDRVGTGFGLSYLFLSPEYQGNTSFFSFLLIGFSFGGLTMAFHSYSYMRLASRFPFLAMVNKPFVRFCINNSIIPTTFIIFFLVRIIRFQRMEEFESWLNVFLFSSGFLVGFFLFVGVALLYFFPINKNLFELKWYKEDKSARNDRWVSFGKRNRIKVKGVNKQRLYWYIGRRGRVQQCRSTKHYAQSLLQSVFDQNRISTTVFEVVTILAFVGVGLFGGATFLDVPAGVSVVLLMTILLMLLSALMSWLRFWAYPTIILCFLVMNYLSKTVDMFKFQTQAYGLSYDHPAVYSDSAIYNLSKNVDVRNEDYYHYISYLESWKKRTGESKPLLVVVNTSGGGSRSAAWVFQVLRVCDSLSNFKSSKHIAMITGASGGTVGASYYRSLLLENYQTRKVDFSDGKYFEEISQDLLNKLAFAASTNDLFFRYQSSFENSDYSYDRAMAFESDLNENTGQRLNKPLRYYRVFEKKGIIPNLILTPSVVNDARRIMISSLGLSFMMDSASPSPETNQVQEDIDIHLLLKRQKSDKLRLSSALRMNASFPYVLPMTSLPTKPEIQLMDAGARDNFGTKLTVRWLKVLESWISKNTRGVVILQIRDNKRIMYNEQTRSFGLFDKFTAPISNVFSNFPRIQDYDQDELLSLALDKYDVPVQMVNLNLRELQKDRISLSWHLTKREKLKVLAAIKRSSNVKEFERYRKLIENSK